MKKTILNFSAATILAMSLQGASARPPPPPSPRIASPFLDVMVQELSARGWQVHSNPPTYEIPITDANGNTYFFHGVSLLKAENSRMQYFHSKIDVNPDPDRMSEELVVRDNLPHAIRQGFQMVYLQHANALSQQDLSTIESVLVSGNLTEIHDSTTMPVANIQWSAIKSLYK